MSSYKEIPWMPFRNDVKDFLDLAKDRNYVHALTEADVTKVSDMFRERKKKGLKNNSMTAYLMWCYGQALHKHPEVQAIRTGKKLVLFDDVDIAMMIEKDLPNGKKLPFPYIFRSVQKKSFDELNNELNEVKNISFDEIRKKKKSLIIRSFPKFLRMFILKRLLNDPFRSKEVLGTVALTCLGMVVTNRKFWPVPLGPYPCAIASGATYLKKEPDGDRKMMCLTVCIDHDLSDGAPVARFGKTLVSLLESGAGIK